MVSNVDIVTVLLTSVVVLCSTRHTRPRLIVGHEDGMIRIYDLPQSHSSDSTKDPFVRITVKITK